MEEKTISPKKTARLAASLFFFVCIPLSFWGQTYVLSNIFVPQDPTATANNLLSNEFIFRMSIVSHLVDTIFFCPDDVAVLPTLEAGGQTSITAHASSRTGANYDCLYP